MVPSCVWFFIVGALWGCTNPFLKQSGSGQQLEIKHTGESFLARLGREVGQLILNWRFLLPFGLNQLGSVLFLSTLASAGISMAPPLCNSLAFVFTIITARLLGEKELSARTILGMSLVLAGSAVCIYAGSSDAETTEIRIQENS